MPAVSPRGFIVIVALLFFGSATLTLAWCASMSAMPGMEMPGGWTMSMTWMRMPGQGWLDAAASFLGMWTVMMIAMMLPALAPLLWRYRLSVASAGARRDGLTAVVGAGYFGVWILSGVLAWPLGVALAEAEMRWPMLASIVPVAGGLLTMFSGGLQLSGWKARALHCCRPAAPPRASSSSIGAAWRLGIHLGLQCFRCCLPMTAVLFIAGVMDLRVMALVTAAIVIERLAPGGRRAARLIGFAMIAAGSIYLAALTPGFIA
jgi:predicted metal-binding membrane protein